MLRSDFPTDFTWGTATAAYQIEGSTTADGRGTSIWDTLVRVPGAISDGSTGDIADDHYRLWPADLDLMSALGVNAYRFSISWTRIQAETAREPPIPRVSISTVGSRRLAWSEAWRRGDPVPLGPAAGAAGRGRLGATATSPAGSGVRRDRRRSARRPGRQVDHAERTVGGRARRLPDGRHAPGIRDAAQAVAANHHLLLAHGQAVDRAPRPRRAGDIGITLNLAGRPVTPEAAAARGGARGAAERGLPGPDLPRPLPGAARPVTRPTPPPPPALCRTATSG